MELYSRIQTDLHLLFVLLSSITLTVYAKDLSKCQPIVHQLNQYADAFGEYCYVFVNEEKYWTAARQYCWNHGGEMLEVDDQATMVFIRNTLNSRTLGWSRNGVWLGAQDRHKEGHWIWSSNKPMKYDYWEKGQPRSILGTGISFEDCACMMRKDNWRWHDCPCELLGWKYNFICQYRIPTTTTTTTTSTTTTTTLPTTTTTSSTTVLPAVSVKTYDVSGRDKDYTISVIHGMLSRRKGPLHKGESRTSAVSKGSEVEYHTGSLDSGSKDRGAHIALAVVSVCLVLILLCIVFIVYRRRQRKKPNREDEPPQFENLSYAQLRQGEAEGAEPDAACFSANQMNTLYEEVSKPVNHGVNYYSNINPGACADALLKPKVTNVDAAKENNATYEKIVEKPPPVKIVNNQLYDIENKVEGATAAPESVAASPADAALPPASATGLPEESPKQFEDDENPYEDMN